jgi:hypothetical protein
MVDRNASPASRDDAAVSEFVEQFAASLTRAGMPRMPARVFAALLVSDSGRLTAAELAEQLRVSPAAISGAVRYLAQVNYLRREREPKARSDVIVLYENAWYEASLRTNPLLSGLEANLADGVRAVGADTPAGARMARTRAFLEFFDAEMAKMMTRWREHEAEPRRPKD